MEEKVKNAQKKLPLTKREKETIIKEVNKMSVVFNFIQTDMHNEQWMDSDHAPTYRGLPGGLTYIYTLSLINLTRWLKWLTIALLALTIVLLTGAIFDWF